MNTPRNPGVIHAPVGRYVHQIEVTNPTRLLFISGQVGMEADGSIPDDPVDQLGVAFENVVRNLGAAGMGVSGSRETARSARPSSILATRERCKSACCSGSGWSAASACSRISRT